MKKENVIKTKKCLGVIIATLLSVTMLMGCGKKAAEEVKEEQK